MEGSEGSGKVSVSRAGVCGAIDVRIARIDQTCFDQNDIVREVGARLKVKRDENGETLTSSSRVDHGRMKVAIR